MNNNVEKERPPEKMEAAWDRMSADYGDRLNLAPSNQCYMELAKGLPQTPRELKILDLGSGLGYQLDQILLRVPNALITCVDMSKNMLTQLVDRLSKYKGQITTQHQSYVGADFGESHFDYVISSKTVHHLQRETKIELFRSIRRALKDRGDYLELDDIMSRKEQEIAAQKEYEKRFSSLEGAATGEWNHNLNCTIETEKKLLEESGFSQVEVPWHEFSDSGYGLAVFVCRK